MNFSELLQCIVCREVKTNPKESKCCHKLFCQDCIESLTNPDVCSICRRQTYFSENIYVSQLINIKLCDYSGNTFRNNLPQKFQTIVNNYLSQRYPDSD